MTSGRSEDAEAHMLQEDGTCNGDIHIKASWGQEWSLKPCVAHTGHTQ